MTSPRLETALEDGSLALPADGRVLVLRCPPQMGALLPLDRCDVVHGFAPLHEAWQAQGFHLIDQPGSGYTMAVVGCPRGRDHARQLVAQAVAAVAPDGWVVVDGQKTDGIEPLMKALKAAVGSVESISKAHGKLVWFRRPAVIPDTVQAWAQLTPNAPTGWVTATGVFSAEAVDAGSDLLARSLPPLKGRVCDLGAGWGYLSRAILAQQKVALVDLVEAEHAALQAARQNIQDPRAQFHWTDATRFGTAQSYDHVVTNPPFHNGRAADPGVGQAFLKRAQILLKPKGSLTLVANRHLPYERTLSDGFAEVQTLATTNGFKVIHASRPRAAR